MRMLTKPLTLALGVILILSAGTTVSSQESQSEMIAINPKIEEGAMLLDGTLLFRDKAIQLAEKYGKRTTSNSRASEPLIEEGDVVTFWAYDFYAGSYYQTDATLRKIGEHCYFFLENGLSMSDENINSLVDEFDNISYPTDVETFGEEPRPPHDIDNDLRITILVLELNGVGGYFDPSNEYEHNPPFVYSNEREMFYTNYNMGINAIKSTNTHEFQHLIHWNQDVNEEAWINEGCSQLAEYLCGYGHPETAWYFEDNPDTSLTNWEYSAASYGANYMFILYFYEHFGGASIIHDLVAEQSNGIYGVNNVLSNNNYSETFEEVFSNWAVANYIDDTTISNGEYGYENINFQVELSNSHSSFPVSNSGSVEYWAADYVRFYDETGTLVINFDGGDNNDFKANTIEIDSSISISTLSIDQDTQEGTIIIEGFGSSINEVIFVIQSVSENGPNPSEYSYNAMITNDTQPFVEITSPDDGDTVSGTVTIQGIAYDNDEGDEIDKVELRIDDGEWFLVSGTDSWIYQWDTTEVENGNHTIKARAFDGILYSNSDMITLFVENPFGPNISDIPDRWLDEDETLVNTLDLDDYVFDPDNPDSEITWEVSGNINIAIEIDENHLVTIIPSKDWYGQEEVTFTAIDPTEMQDSDVMVITVNAVNDAPSVKENLPDVEFDEDSSHEAFDLDDYFEDVDDDTLSYSYMGNTNVNVLIDENNSVTFSAPENWYGCETITFTARDSEYSVNDTMVVSINPLPDPPVLIKELPDLKFDEDSSIQNAFDLDDYFFDADADPLEYSYEGNVNVVVYIDENNSVSFSVVENWYGKENITLIASDGLYSAQGTVSITVISKQDSPILIKQIPDVTFDEDTLLKNAFYLNAYFDDIDGDTLTFYAKGNENVHVTINANSSVDFSTEENWFGQEEVTFIAQDVSGSAECTVKVTVRSVNDPPLIAVYPITGKIEGTYQVKGSASDIDSNISKVEIKVDNSTWMMATDTSKNKDWSSWEYLLDTTVFSDGIYSIYAIAYDEFSNSSIVMITVEIDNAHAPEVSALPDVTFDEDTTLKNAFNLNDYFFDADNDTLNFRHFASNNITVTIHDNGSVDFSADDDWFGVERVTFRAEDIDNLIATYTINVTVNPVNDVPVITSKPETKAIEDKEYFYKLKVEDKDNDEIQFLLLLKPAGMLISETGRIIWTPTNDDVGTVEVRIRVTDGTAFAYQNFSIDVENVNDAPHVSIIEPQNNSTFNVNTKVTFRVSAFDIDAKDKIKHYYWDFDHDGAFELIADNDTIDYEFFEPGIYVVSVKVSDSDGLESEVDSVTVIIKGVKSTDNSNGFLSIESAIIILSLLIALALRYRRR